MRLFWIVPILGLALSLSGPSQAQSLQPCPDALAKEAPPEPEMGQKWTFTFSPYVHHWTYDPTHAHAFVVGLERRVAGDRFCGLALFRNSFGQPSGYLYVGQRWDNIWGASQLSFKVSVGVIYGYVGEHRDKVPFNWNGFSPTIIPALVYQFTPHDSLDVMVLGMAGLTFGYSRNF